MKPIQALKNILSGLYQSIKRFPVTIFMSLSTAAVLIALSEIQSVPGQDIMEILQRAAMITALGIPLSLCIKLCLERKEGGGILKLFIMYSLGLAVLIIYYFMFLNKLGMVDITRYTAISIALYTGFLFIPYFPGRENYEKYIIKVVTAFIITAIYSGVLFGGLAAILFTINKLLGVYVAGKVYLYTWLFVVFGFAVSYFLSGVPQNDEEMPKESYPKVLKILLLYIVMPLLTVYNLILYIYFIKIIVTLKWPVGMVSNLVLWYSLINSAVLFFITPLKGENRWVRLYHRYSPKAGVPLLIMMFISMGIRISAYGITENRYYVMILGIWAACMMLYFSLAKRNLNIILPVTLSIIALISVLGPFSSYSVSKWSQNRRLEGILSQNNMVKDGKIQPSSNILPDDKDEICRILDYFSVNHSLADVKILPSSFIIEDMKNTFGFDYKGNIGADKGGYFNYSIDNSSNAVDIKGYDYLFDTRALYNKNNGSEGEYDAVYDPETQVVRISMGQKVVYEKDLNLFAEELAKRYGMSQNGGLIPLKDMTFTDQNQYVGVKFIIMYMSGSKINEEGKIKLNGAEFYLLVR